MAQIPDKSPTGGSNSAAISGADIRQLIEIAPLPVFLVDHLRNLTDFNLAACQFLGYQSSELLGRNIDELACHSDALRWMDITRRVSGGPQKSEVCQFRRSDGDTVWGEVNARPMTEGRWLIFVNDISARKQAELSIIDAEKQRWKAQKIVALERLAGGIAHDFNNFLAVILLQTDMINLQLPDDSSVANRVNEIKAVANDAAGIVRQLLAFGRRQPMNPAPGVINNLIETSARDIRALVGEKIEVKISLDPSLGVSFVDQKQLAQALLYLAINAADAMPDGGTLRIETSNINIGRAASYSVQSSGAYIQISISDTGNGMDEKTEENLFEPFFSTKSADKAAGLGLATVYGIVKQSGGFIWVNSLQNRGTTFDIQFPRVDQPEIDEPVPAEKTYRGQETILLVDDDSSVRRVAAEALRNAGYNVLEAGSGMEAVQTATLSPESIHLILTDFSMPMMNGRETAQGVKKIHPNAAVLFISGNIANIDIANIDSDGQNGVQDTNILSKPFSFATLVEKVQDVLGS